MFMMFLYITYCKASDVSDTDTVINALPGKLIKK